MGSLLPRLIPVGVFAVASALYLTATSFGFAYLDDDRLLLEDRAFLAEPSALTQVFSRPYFADTGLDHAYYRPLVSFSYALDTLRGGDASSYHLTNVLLHALSSALLFTVLRRIGYRAPDAALSSCLFAVHPALTEAVAWLPGRPDLMLALFALGAWWFWSMALERPELRYRVGYLLLWFAALLSKEAAIVLPFVYLAFAKLWLGRSLAIARERWFLFGQLATLCVYLGLRAQALPNGLGAGGLSALEAVANLPALIASAGKLFFPQTLSVLSTPEDSPYWPGLVALGALFWALRSRPLRTPRVAFAAVALGLCLLPNLPASGVLVLECRLYLSAIPMAVLACEVLERASLPVRAKRLLGLVSLSVLAARTLAYLPSFRDRVSFAEASVTGSPGLALAHKNLGITRHLTGEIAAAESEYRKALALDSEEPVVHNNLAVIAMSRGELADAERHLRRELAINPDYAPARDNLARVLAARSRSGQPSGSLPPGP